MLPLISVAYVLGIAVGEWLSLPAHLALLFALAFGFAMVLLWARRRPFGVGMLGCALGIGLLAQAHRVRAPPELVDGSRQGVSGSVAAPLERSFGVARLPLELEEVDQGGRAWSVRGRAKISVPGEPTEPLVPGDRVYLQTVLRRPRGFYNPGAPDIARRAAAEEVIALGSVHRSAALARRVVPPKSSLVLSVTAPLERWRQRSLALLKRLLPEEDQALTASLVLGDRGDIDQALDENFRAAGVSHVLSVSGLHLAIAAFLFYGALTRLLLWVPRLGRGRAVRRWAALVAMPATVAYTLVTGAQVATVRALVVALVWLSAVALGRRTTGLQALSLSALALLIAHPLELFDPSFLLSFAAALGTALLAPRFFSIGASSGWLRRWAGPPFRLIAASLAAILATTPISIFYFSQVSPVGLVSNLLVVPLAELGVVPTGLAGCVLASFAPGLSSLLLRAAGFESHLMAEVVRWFGTHLPSLRVAAPTWFEILAWYGGLLAIAWLGRRSRSWVLLSLLLVSGSMVVRAFDRRSSDQLVATFVDVGQGDACLLELPHGRVALIDGGGSFDAGFDPGLQILAPLLWRRGIDRIDLMILSHPHPDHANGLASLVETFSVGELWVNGAETAQPGTVRLIAAARQRRIPIVQPHPLELGGVSFRPLGPFADGEPAGVKVDPSYGENDNSLVIALGYGGRRLLFAGDVEAAAEADLVRRGQLAADLLKVPHHGSRTSSTEAFVSAVHPEWAVISCGEQNRWGFPHAEVLGRYAAIGARVLRTDLGGAVIVEIDKNGAMRASIFHVPEAARSVLF